MKTLGIIGGSGLYEMPGLSSVREVRLKTPFGSPSDAYLVGMLGEVQLVFLPRHGRGHRLTPGEINARANIWGFKKLGVERLVSVSAVGSMKEHIAPGHVVIVDQFIDHTRGRPSSFFGDGVVGHVSFADPFCPGVASALHEAAVAAGATAHRGGTYLCIEGPQFSTRAESLLYRSWGVDVIGMTNLPEARLAREAELCYATLALPTDYDCWHESEEDVSAQAVVETLKRNVALAQSILKLTATRLAGPRTCACKDALASAVMTDPGHIPASARRKLDLLIGRYLPARPARRISARPARSKKRR